MESLLNLPFIFLIANLITFIAGLLSLFTGIKKIGEENVDIINDVMAYIFPGIMIVILEIIAVMVHIKRYGL